MINGLKSRVVLLVVVVHTARMLLLFLAALHASRATGVNANRFPEKWPDATSVQFETYLAAWDAAHYLHLAYDGYSRADSSSAFYPLWPGVLHSTIAAVGVSRTAAVVPGLILGNLLGILGTLGIYRLFLTVGPERTAEVALGLLLASPGAAFLSLIYSETLCLLLVGGHFYALRRGPGWLIGLTALLLPLSRAVGVFCAVPLFWRAVRLRRDWRAWAVCALPLIGYGLYFTLMWHWTGDALDGFEAQRKYPNQPSLANIANIPRFITSAFDLGSPLGMLDGGLDRLLFVLMLPTLPALWRFNRDWFWWTLFVAIIPAMSNWFFSYRRFIILAFPIFYIWATWMVDSERKWILWYYVILFAAFQAAIIWRYAHFNWAG